MAKNPDPGVLAADLLAALQNRLGIAKGQGVPLPVVHELATRLIAEQLRTGRELRKSARLTRKAARLNATMLEMLQGATAPASLPHPLLTRGFAPLDPATTQLGFITKSTPPPRNGHDPLGPYPPPPPAAPPPGHPEGPR